MKNHYKLEKNLYPTPEKYDEHLLEQYKIYLTDKIWLNNRRGNSNRLFLTLATGLITVTTIFFSNQIVNFSYQNIARLFVSLFGFLLCFPWLINIHSYSKMDYIKTKILINMEKHLPYQGLREFEDSKGKLINLTTAELFMPALFLVSFTLLLIYNIIVII